tara:strand:- start:8983 stop:9201 length:219 start_codon:yes stop_codon:yes gene_type:complete
MSKEEEEREYMKKRLFEAIREPKKYMIMEKITEAKRLISICPEYREVERIGLESKLVYLEAALETLGDEDDR